MQRILVTTIGTGLNYNGEGSKNQHIPFCFLTLDAVWSVISCTSSFLYPDGLFSNYSIFTMFCQIVCQLVMLNMSSTATLPHSPLIPPSIFLRLPSYCTCSQTPFFSHVLMSTFALLILTLQSLEFIQSKDPFGSLLNSTYS